MDGSKYSFEVVVDLNRGEQVVRELLKAGRVAFDSEGVNLGRNGSVTVLSFLALFREAEDSEPTHEDQEQEINVNVRDTAFLVDLSENPLLIDTFKRLLESETVIKVTFDCRADSDALWHLHGVCLENVLELQVYKQAVDRVLGKYVQNIGLNKVRFVSGMSRVCEEMLSKEELKYLDEEFPCGISPHKIEERVWERRPLEDRVWMYAAKDVFYIQHLLTCFEKIDVSEWKEGIKSHSERYATCFRELKLAVEFKKHRRFIMADVPIDQAFIRSDESPKKKEEPAK